MNLDFDGKLDGRTHKEVLSKTLISILETDPDAIYLDADLMSCIGMGSYWEKHKDRAIQCGIAEANMIGIASGLAASGFRPIAHSFGTFASRRCFDQVFLSAGYGRNDITVIGSDPGVCAAYNGGTHMPFEDMALYRSIPGATVVDITDSAMLENLLPKLYRMKGVKYMRMGRKSNIKVYMEGTDFDIGKAVVLKDGSDVTIAAAGIMVGEALAAAKALQEDGISAGVLDMFTVKPLDQDALLSQVRGTKALVTAENHNKIGGLYSAACDLLASKFPAPVEYVAVEDTFGDVGSQAYLQNRFGLTAHRICEKVREVLKRKNP